MRGSELKPGSTFDKRYTIGERMGSGTTSIVYSATDSEAGRAVALKVYKTHDISQARINREVEIFSSLRHPQILEFHRYGETATVPYIDMELAEGHVALRSTKKLSLENAMAVMALTTDAVGYAHEQGYIHRDLKPSSLFYTGTVKVGDWGLSMEYNPPQYLSLQDRIVGTPMYIAPEQFLGRTSPASDLYALGGLVAYEAFTGKRAIKQFTWYDALARQFVVSPPLFENVLKGNMNDVYAAVEIPIRKALAKKTSHRQVSMAEYRFELIEAYEKSQEKQAREQTIIDLGE